MDTIIQMLDMADKNVEIEVSKDGKKLWVNVNEICRLRVNNGFFKHANPENEPSITINDNRITEKSKSSNLILEGKATDHIWAMEDGPESHPIGIRLDCGDSGVVYLSRSQADDLTTMLVNKFGCIIQPKSI